MELFIFLGIFYILFLRKSFVIIKTSEAFVIERFGKYNRTIKRPGLNIIIPFFDKIRARVDLREQTIDIPLQTVITKDNIAIKTEVVVFYQIIDPKSTVYEVQNLSSSIKYLTQTIMRDVIGEMELTTTLTSRDVINTQINQALDENTDKWGCKVTRVEITNFDIPKDIKEGLQKNSSNFNSTNTSTYQYSTFFKQTVQPGDVVRVLKVDGSNLTIEKIN